MTSRRRPTRRDPCCWRSYTLFAHHGHNPRSFLFGSTAVYCGTLWDCCSATPPLIVVVVGCCRTRSRWILRIQCSPTTGGRTNQYSSTSRCGVPLGPLGPVACNKSGLDKTIFQSQKRSFLRFLPLFNTCYTALLPVVPYVRETRDKNENVHKM